MSKPMKIILAISVLVGIVLFGAMFYLSTRRIEGVDHEHMEQAEQVRTPSGTLQDGVRVIKMRARRFEFDPSIVVVKQGETVRLEVTSEDTVHGIAMADFGIDRKLPEQQTQTIEFVADMPGEHHFHCSVFCGSGHDDMQGKLIVLAE